MLKATLANVLMIKKIFEVANELITDVPIECTPNGLYVSAMDSSHVAVVTITLGANVFRTYSCEQQLTFGINLDQLLTALKCGHFDHTCSLAYAPNEPDKLQISFVGNKGNETQDILINLLDTEAEILRTPHTNNVATVKLGAEHLRKIIMDLSHYSYELVLIVGPGQVTFESKGDCGSNKVVLKTDQEVVNVNEQLLPYDRLLVISATTLLKNRFAMRYVQNITKAAIVSPVVTLIVRYDSPLIFEYELGADSKMEFVLSQKINNNF